MAAGQAAPARGIALSELADAAIGGQLHGDASVRVSGVQHDSRQVQAGDLFVAIRGEHADGTRFVGDALARGAVAVVAEEVLEHEVPQLVVQDARYALAHAAEHVYGRPTRQLQTVGITGTNGKTTTAWLVEAAIAQCGGRPGLLGTIATRVPEQAGATSPYGSRPGLHGPTLTTPESDDIARFARQVLDARGTHLVMEVSSHALALRRVDAMCFRVAAFTNLGRDHLDFHGDVERYAQAKERLFTTLRPEASVINVDDPFGHELASRAHGAVWRCSMHANAEAEVRALDWSVQREGISARVATPAGELAIQSPLLGAHNAQNLVLALGCGLALELDPQQLVAGLSRAPGAPGRLERVFHPGDINVLVDYAHSPEALEHVLSTLRPLTPGRLILVFGCGGDRDRQKRPAMGEVAGHGADLIVVTSDNPRGEDPSDIIDAITPGVARANGPGMGNANESRRQRIKRLSEADCGYVVEEDRREAIRLALSSVRAGDTVVLAGKGHETYQVVGDDVRSFDDREEARRVIESQEADG